MVQKIAMSLLMVIAVVALVGFTWNWNELTGNFVKSGGGSWYYGPMRAQMEPKEACIAAGLQPVSPAEVFRNSYGTALSLCRQGENLVGVPLVQTIYSAP